MGRQFSLFLGPADQLPFEKALRKVDDIVLLDSCPSTQPPVELDDTSFFMTNYCPRILIARRDDVSSIKFKYIKEQDYFVCDPIVQPIVEFDMCYVSNSVIGVGRLYRVDSYWNDDNMRVQKSSEFTTWADRLYRFGKASLTKVHPNMFAGQEALRMREAGIAFENLDVPRGAHLNQNRQAD